MHEIVQDLLLDKELLLMCVMLEQVAHAETQELAKALRVAHLPGLLEQVRWRHVHIVQGAPVLDLLQSSRVEQTLRHAVVHEVGELKSC